jgi:hypothetical protein
MAYGGEYLEKPQVVIFDKTNSKKGKPIFNLGKKDIMQLEKY